MMGGESMYMDIKSSCKEQAECAPLDNNNLVQKQGLFEWHVGLARIFILSLIARLN